MVKLGRQERLSIDQISKIVKLRTIDHLPIKVIAERFGRRQNNISYVLSRELKKIK